MINLTPSGRKYVYGEKEVKKVPMISFRYWMTYY